DGHYEDAFLREQPGRTGTDSLRPGRKPGAPPTSRTTESHARAALEFSSEKKCNSKSDNRSGFLSRLYAAPSDLSHWRQIPWARFTSFPKEWPTRSPPAKWWSAQRRW